MADNVSRRDQWGLLVLQYSDMRDLEQVRRLS